jgi:hypothetical protein
MVLHRPIETTDYTGKWTEKLAVSDNGPSDPEYFRLARHPSKILEQLSKMRNSSPLVCASL